MNSIFGPVVALDTETTGLNPTTEDIFEVAVASRRSLQTWCVEPSPEAVASMHPKAAEVNRYHERTAADDWAWSNAQQARDEVREILDGAHIVGAVPDFDTRFLTEWYRRAGEEPPRWHYHLIDVEALAVGFLRARLPEVPLRLPWRSDDLSRMLGIEPPEGDRRHTAGADAIWAWSIYERIVGAP